VRPASTAHLPGEEVLGGRAGGGDRIPRDAQRQGQVVARPGRDDGQRGRRPGDGLQRGVRGTVATDGDHGPGSGGDRVGGLLLGLGPRGGG